MTAANADTAHRTFVSYIDKSREYYEASGYDRPYRWAHHNDVPFARLDRPLAESTVAVVTTSFIFNPATDDGDDGGLMVRADKEVYAAPSSPTPERMFTMDLSWDKGATHTDDVGSFLPLDALGRAAEAGRIGAVAPRYFGVPTQYSQRRSGLDAEVIAGWCRDDGVDAVVLVPL